MYINNIFYSLKTCAAIIIRYIDPQFQMKKLNKPINYDVYDH